MKTVTTLAALMLALFITQPLTAQTTTTVNFDAIGLTGVLDGPLGSFLNPTNRGTALKNTYPAPTIKDFGGEAHTQQYGSNNNSISFPANGGLEFRTYNPPGSTFGSSRMVMFEHPRDFIEFGPFQYGIAANNISFVMHNFYGSQTSPYSKGIVEVTAFNSSGTAVSTQSFQVNTDRGWNSAAYPENNIVAFCSFQYAVPTNGYFRIKRTSLYGDASLLYPNGNFYLDDIVFTPTPVPVELTAFRCSVLDERVRLNWTTATELNNFGFEVERSMDRENWSSLGFVQGHGTSFSPKQYDYMDVDPDWSAGVLFYRLRQIDRDGTTDYSPIVRADRVGASAEVFGMNVFPQPFNNSVQVQLTAREETHMLVTLYNSLLQEVATLHDGMVRGTVTASHPTETLLDGNYFVVLRAGDQAPIVRKIVKLSAR